MKTILTCLCLLMITGISAAQSKADADAVNKVLDKYLETEVARDMMAQSKLMSSDRVWIGPYTAGRRTNQQLNMQLQQAGMDEEKKLVPGLRYFIDDRGQIIKFYGTVAVVSFFRYTNVVVPASTPAEVARNYAGPIPPVAVTLVLAKEQGDWKIVHSHVSSMSAPSGQ